jgi:ribonuclease D
VLDSPEKLAAFLPTLASAQWVAVDTEADSLHAYPEKVCLIQVSTAAGDRLVDPLAPLALDQFLAELSRHRLIMHGADYDLRLLRKHHDFIPRDIFDTMLAARLLGVRHFSLSDLVEQFVGVKLEKGSQKANWAMRPLTERMEKYARNDTHYLKPLSDRLAHQLEARGRLGWHQEYCQWLIRESSRPKEENQDEVWRLKGCHQLERAGLAVLRELWKWREHEALTANRPPFFILSHESLVRLASAAASGRPVEPLLPRHLSERRRTGLLRAAARGCAVPPEQQPRQLRFAGRRPSEGEKRRHQELQRRRDAHAARLGIDPTLIASRAIISSLAHDWDKHATELMDWQRELLSDGAHPPATGPSLAKSD